MKTLKISLMALVFTLGIGGAVVQKIQAAPKLTDPTYDWTATSGDFNNATVAQAESHYGCSGNKAVCATGTLDQGSGPATAQINKN